MISGHLVKVLKQSLSDIGALPEFISILKKKLDESKWAKSIKIYIIRTIYYYYYYLKKE